jgi:4-aminobutyrate aminotransferase
MQANELLGLDERYLMQCFPKRDDLVVVKAEGSHIYDASGKTYLDLFSGIAVANVGHRHPKVVEAIKSQLDRYMHISNYYYNDVEPVLAKMLKEVAPGRLARTFFANSGSEAIEGAVKLAKKYAYKSNKNGMTLVSLEGSFHGRLSLSLTLTGQKKIKQKMAHYACYPGVVYAPAPYHYRHGDGLSPAEFGRKRAEDLAELLDDYAPTDVAALFIEPVMGEGGIVVPPDTYLPAVQRICEQRQIPLAIDEVQTGIARTGKMFASEHWAINPDVMTIAKALGGGLPIGAFMATEDVARAFEEGDHFSTFGGNPVACAAAIAVLEVVRDEQLVARSARIGQHTIKRLEEIAKKNDLIGEVRGKGLMMGIELVRNLKTKEPADKEAIVIKQQLRKKGYLIGIGGLHKNVLRIQPPLIIQENDLDGAVDALQESLKGVGRN